MLPQRFGTLVAAFLACAIADHPKDKRPHLADILQAAVDASVGDFAGVRAARASKYAEEPLLDDDYPNDSTDGGLGNLWTPEQPHPTTPRPPPTTTPHPSTNATKCVTI